MKAVLKTHYVKVQIAYVNFKMIDVSIGRSVCSGDYEIHRDVEPGLRKLVCVGLTYFTGPLMRDSPDS